MNVAQHLAALGRTVAADESKPAAVRDAVLGLLSAMFAPDEADVSVTEWPAARRGSLPPISTDPARSIDVSNACRISLGPGAELTEERAPLFDAARSYVALWSNARRLQAHNKFAVQSVADLRRSPPRPRWGRAWSVARLATGVLGVSGAIVVALDADERAAAYGTFDVAVMKRDNLATAR
ncbi:MAG: hypothetical protein R3B70_48085 [Polyangiaceae bacterium]